MNKKRNETKRNELYRINGQMKGPVQHIHNETDGVADRLANGQTDKPTDQRMNEQAKRENC